MALRTTIRRVTLVQVETVAHELACELFQNYGEPIPAFATRFPEKLESCLATPFQKWEGVSLYKGLVGKGAALFYLMIKNHPFQNGNKRVAVMTLFYFLHINNKWLSVDNDRLYLFAKQVAKSDPKDKSKTIDEIQSFLSKHLIDSPVVTDV